ncbi:hypothetical protein [Formosa maritima]|uniref:Uncharacterized protein n=1 Tax=Formosa maritima TaxID=2592046 RepID=A0A5D0G384_9FLAO|nr:hypothetical protein [Formosa maritima]TYA52327.1 hypothetical protein FVF61_13375 [Formosa maritima]
MKFLITLITTCSLFILSLELSQVRVAYKEAAHDKTKVEAFNKMLEGVTKNSTVTLVAYKGASIALKAKFAETVKEKKEGFFDGVSYIEFAIEKEPNAIEPRFVRIGIQENSPKILKYKDNIDEDKLFLLKQYNNISSTDLKKHVKDYILQSNVFTDLEKQSINNQ